MKMIFFISASVFLFTFELNAQTVIRDSIETDTAEIIYRNNNIFNYVTEDSSKKHFSEQKPKSSVFLIYDVENLKLNKMQFDKSYSFRSENLPENKLAIFKKYLTKMLALQYSEAAKLDLGEFGKYLSYAQNAAAIILAILSLTRH